MDFLETENARQSADIAHLDSILAEQEKLMRSIRADQNYNSQALQDEIRIVEGILRESGYRVSTLGQKLEDIQKEMRRPVEEDTTAADTTDTLYQEKNDFAPGQLYETAYLDQKRGSYDMAIAGYRGLIDALGDTTSSEFADDALFGLAECFFAMNSPDSAASYYQILLERFPKSSLVPTTLYKMGISLEKLDRLQDARRVFSTLVERYPSAPETPLAKEHLSEK